jgi:hypothetical protein
LIRLKKSRFLVASLLGMTWVIRVAGETPALL